MRFLNILDTLFFGPLELLFEILFQIANRYVGHPAIAIAVLSLAMNLLVLPLYRRADAISRINREKENKMHRGIAHIKKHFKGDERLMLLQTYYRQNGYQVTDVLAGSLPLLLQIPFFVAAYRFLSHLQVVQGVSLGPIADLSKPDGLLGEKLHLLPLLMTAINVLSSLLYLKGRPWKDKLQVFGLAAVFLVFLYDSPACLVLYWTLNNLFSLVKNIIDKTVKRKGKKRTVREYTPHRGVFFASTGICAVLTGILIPSAFLAASPLEFVDLSCYQHPGMYLVSSFCIAAGGLFLWPAIYYGMAGKKGKVLLERAAWILWGVMLVNYLFFGTKLGNLSPEMKYDNGMHFLLGEQVGNVLAVGAVAAALWFVLSKWKKAAVAAACTVLLALGIMSGVNAVKTHDSVSAMLAVQETGQKDTPQITLDKTGKNVVIIMLDRAMGQYVPYILQEKPELKQQLSGFTYYSNVISHGGCTNFSVPSLFGGYEYTPVEMNRRKNESLVSKHNEALKVLPRIFLENGYDVTLCDPVYANYSQIPDTSIFDDLPGVKTYITEGAFSDTEAKEYAIQKNHRNFFCFAFMKTMPVLLQPILYDGGQYHTADTHTGVAAVYDTQKTQGLSQAEGLSKTFMESYNVLTALPEITCITDKGVNTFLTFSNETTHGPMLLQTPDYVPADVVDNREYDLQNADRFTADGRTMDMSKDYQMVHYHANVAALLRLGTWLDHLKAEGVYDNTRIILVSDHGHNTSQLQELLLDGGFSADKDAERYFPLLMVKDFESEKFSVSNEFMTLADVPVISLQGIVNDPVNPYTGKRITNEEKTKHSQHIIASFEWDTEINNGNTFLPSKWLAVKENIWDRRNWVAIDETKVLTDYWVP